jgi:hypothetical protein
MSSRPLYGPGMTDFDRAEIWNERWVVLEDDERVDLMAGRGFRAPPVSVPTALGEEGGHSTSCTWWMHLVAPGANPHVDPPGNTCLRCGTIVAWATAATKLELYKAFSNRCDLRLCDRPPHDECGAIGFLALDVPT